MEVDLVKGERQIRQIPIAVCSKRLSPFHSYRGIGQNAPNGLFGFLNEGGNVAEIGLWHAMRGAQPTRLLEEDIALERDLEDWVFEDPTLISPALHRVRRQVPLGNKFIDLLAIEEPGVWVVCELKKTPLYRDSIAQAFDYVTRLDLLNHEEFRSVVNYVANTHTERTQNLINKALDRETNGEERSIRVVLAGLGVREDLQHMVNFLSNKYSFPISICTFSAVSTPGDEQGVILMRDISEDSTTEVFDGPTTVEYNVRLLNVKQYFGNSLQTSIFNKLCEIFGAEDNFFVRPWKKSIMVAPHQHHGRYLAYFTSNRDGVRAMVSPEAILEFFPDADVAGITPEMTDIHFDNLLAAQNWATSISQTVANVVGQTTPVASEWNGKDWYFAFGGSESRNWQDAIKYGFVSAGGGDWYSRTVRTLPVGARIFVYMPKIGYVGVGTTKGPAVSYLESDEWRQKDLLGQYTHQNGEAEYMVPVNWIKTVTSERAIYGNGLFASQHSTCKLRDKKTLKVLTEGFDVPNFEEHEKKH
jgi:hypothetical protein